MTYTVNGTTWAATTLATFNAAQSYVLQVTVRNTNGQFATSATTVGVERTSNFFVRG